ncbi:50S ribosomal protein L13 [Patescibacteria group bacterium]
MKPEIYTIDVKDRILGRAATEVASLLRGKNSTDFKPNIVPLVQVKIVNVDKIKVSGNKMKQKTYSSYSGYPGGLKKTPMEKVFSKDPRKVFQKAVKGMLPKNRLQKVFMKNLMFDPPEGRVN